MKICEEFVSFQGEVNVGRLAYFIIASGCSLCCNYCDRNYAKTEWVEVTVDSLIKKAIHFPRVVITGGEPLLQLDELIKLVKGIKKHNPEAVVEIETNGTIKPIGLSSLNIVWNVSPKLKSSGNEGKERIINSILNNFSLAGANFKFVVANVENDFDEINMIVTDIGIPKNQVFLIPEGKTRDEQLIKMEVLAKYAKYFGYNISPRLHILIYDDKRGV